MLAPHPRGELLHRAAADLLCSPPVPAVVIQHAVWLYLRFTLSYRDVEDLLAERGLDTSYETARRWVLKFGPAFARRLRQRRPKPSSRWHLDEMAILSAKSRSRLAVWIAAGVRAGVTTRNATSPTKCP